MITVEPGLIQTIERIGTGEGWTVPNGASLETRVRGVTYRELVEGEDLAVRAGRRMAGAGRGRPVRPAGGGGRARPAPRPRRGGLAPATPPQSDWSWSARVKVQVRVM